MSYLSSERWRLNHWERDHHKARDPLGGDNVHRPRKRRQTGPALTYTATAASTSTSTTSATFGLLHRLPGSANPKTPHQVLGSVPRIVNAHLEKLLQLRVRSCEPLHLPQSVLACPLHEWREWSRNHKVPNPSDWHDTQSPKYHCQS